MFPLPVHRFHNAPIQQHRSPNSFNYDPNFFVNQKSNHRYEMSSSSTSNCEVITSRGFKPSDRRDPQKREFLMNLSKKICHLDDHMNPVPRHQLNRSRSFLNSLTPDSRSREEFNFSTNPSPNKLDLQKIFSPATDQNDYDLKQRNRKSFASSAFYNSGLHPTKDEQVKLAQQISASLSDVNNKKSKGQTMYLNRKQRSVRWVHEGQGKAKVEEQNYWETNERDSKGQMHKEVSENKHSYTVPASKRNDVRPNFIGNSAPQPITGYMDDGFRYKSSYALNDYGGSKLPEPKPWNVKRNLQPYITRSQTTHFAPPAAKTFNLSNCNNFNRSPKGWLSHYHRPQYI